MRMMEEDVCGDFFNHIDDLLDFPVESLDIAGDAELLPGEAQAGQDRLWDVADGGAATSSPLFSDDDLAAGLAVPMEDIAELEWLSTFVEDSFAAGSVAAESKLLQKDARFRTASPVSVLESSSPAGQPAPLAAVAVPGRARSKRSRPASFFPRPLLSPDSFAAAHSQKKKPSPAPAPAAGVLAASAAAGVRKCTHCEITKTPQWRAGPAGPKTLCNACGVRYKSGRLFPEYRPAASPTFVAAVHSNSHKKVVEMRIKSGKKEPAPVPYFVRKNNININNNNTNMALLDCNVHN